LDSQQAGPRNARAGLRDEPSNPSMRCDNGKRRERRKSAFCCLAERDCRRTLWFDKIAWSDFGQPQAGPSNARAGLRDEPSNPSTRCDNGKRSERRKSAFCCLASSAAWTSRRGSTKLPAEFLRVFDRTRGFAK